MINNRFSKKIDENGIYFLRQKFHATDSKNLIKKYKAVYSRTFEVALSIALFLMIMLFQGWKNHSDVKKEQKVEVPILVADIPQTVQDKRPPAPARPAIPMESEEENIPEDLTIESTDIDLSELPPPPPPPEEKEEEVEIFIAYDEAPEPIGGFMAIQRNLVYPEIARKANVEGRVIVQVLIDKNGTVREVQVLKSMGLDECDQAAIQAIQAVQWKPAKQRDKTVAVWVTIPISFKLS